MNEIETVTDPFQNTTEHPFFHFNEALFKPFENLVCLELADVDVQDQIVTSICDFVETNTAEINSGWRSLFGALKGVHFPVEIRYGSLVILSKLSSNFPTIWLNY